MSDDIHEPIIDSLLAELLGGEKAPDLKLRLLAEHERTRARAGVSTERGEFVERTDPSATLHPISRRIAARRRADWRGWATVALTLVVASVVAIWTLQHVGQVPEIAENPLESSESSELTPNSLEGVPQLPDQTESTSALAAAPSEPPELEKVPAQPMPGPPRRTGIQRIPINRVVASDQEIVQFVDSRLRARWKEENIKPSRTINDREWCYRTFRVLTGGNPNQEEIDEFLESRDNDKRGALVNKLCTSHRFYDHWSAKLADVLIGSGQSPNGADRSELERYLRSSLKDEKPYDQLAFDLISAEGTNQPNQADHNAATNFLLALADDGTDGPITNKVCQVFLGRQVGCAKCHDHPEDPNLRQQQYWQLAAYFEQTRTRSNASGNGQFLFNQDYPGSHGDLSAAETSYQDHKEQRRREVFPRFLDGTESSSSGLLSESVRRDGLANKIVNSDDFSRAFVNRLWDQLMGAGFTVPVDDMGPHNRPSHPLLLDRLAVEFQASKFSVRDLTRWMVLSSAFDRSERRPRDLIVSGGEYLFDYFESDLREPKNEAPESLAELMETLAVLSTRGDKVVAGNLGIGSMEQDAADRLAEANTELLERYVSGPLDVRVGRLASSPNLDDRQKVEHLFMTLLGRVPDSVEAAEAMKLLRIASPTQALRDIALTVMNSKEFDKEH